MMIKRTDPHITLMAVIFLKQPSHLRKQEEKTTSSHVFTWSSSQTVMQNEVP